MVTKYRFSESLCLFFNAFCKKLTIEAAAISGKPLHSSTFIDIPLHSGGPLNQYLTWKWGRWLPNASRHNAPDTPSHTHKPQTHHKPRKRYMR